MGRHEDSIPPNPNLYPQELQLKLYQAFIFSIPILFAIILFLLFSLFYLKRRANSISSQPSTVQQSTSNQSNSFLSPPWNLGLKGELKDDLNMILFDENLRAKDSLCCVCLGEFEMKEELRQLPLCKHVFHNECIQLWLRANATCPLCRCHVISTIKMGQPIGLERGPIRQGNGPESSLNMNYSPSSQEHVVQIVEAFQIPS